MLASLISVLLIGKAFMFAGEIRYGTGRAWPWLAATSASYMIAAPLSWELHWPTVMAFFAFLAGFWAYYAWKDWKKRPPRKGKKALRTLGAKARARLAAMKKAMPPIRIPRLAPVPG